MEQLRQMKHELQMKIIQNNIRRMQQRQEIDERLHQQIQEAGRQWLNKKEELRQARDEQQLKGIVHTAGEKQIKNENLAGKNVNGKRKKEENYFKKRR